jgi:hypothetical protein
MEGKQRRSAHSLRDLLKRLRRFFMPRVEPIEPEPEDPYAYRMAPLRRPPTKGGAAAVAELDEEELEEK